MFPALALPYGLEDREHYPGTEVLLIEAERVAEFLPVVDEQLQRRVARRAEPWYWSWAWS